MGKIYALYLKGDMDQAKIIYDEMKKEGNISTFEQLGMLFS
jgi:hypothetical protein